MANIRAFAPGYRSPTAAQGKSDLRDDFVYSSLVVAHGGTGSQKLFTVPQGQAIPALKGSAITLAAAHHLTHSELTTNLTKAGELGQSVGDVSVRSIALNIETAPAKADGTYDTYGATPQDVQEILNKLFFQFKVGGKIATQAPVWAYPAAGGPGGSIGVSGAASAANYGILHNGSLIGGGKKMRLPISISRVDTVEAVLGTANGSSLAFKTTSSAGQETLVTCLLGVLVAGDVR